MDYYKEMYYKLFNKITVIINQLQVAQQETEEMFISQEHEIKTLNVCQNKNNKD